jgi:hypothetical protein
LRNENKLGYSSGVGREFGEKLFGSCYRYSGTKQVKCKENAKDEK